MPVVRLRVAMRERVELCELDRAEIALGRAAFSDVLIHHPSVAMHHARLLVRRGRIILVGLEHSRGAVTWRASREGRERVTSPVALQDGAVFGLGEVELRVQTAAAASPVDIGAVLGGYRVERESEAPDSRMRRYLCVGAQPSGAEETAELSLSERAPAPVVDAWLERVRATAGQAQAQYPRVCDVGRLGERGFLLEALPAGIRLSVLLAKIRRRALRLPAAGALALVALAVESVARVHAHLGAHGQLDPARFQVTFDGAVRVLRPGPDLDARSRAVEDEFIAPEQRLEPAPSPAGDAYALGVLGKRLIADRADCPPRMRALCTWLAHADARRRPRDLAELAEEARATVFSSGQDPSSAHVARAARLAGGEDATPLVQVGGESRV